MTIDVDPPISTIPSFIIKQGVIHLLKLLDENGIKATFFVPAVVAKKFSVTVIEIAKRGHEVACHGLRHDPYEATLKISKQIQIIKKATKIIQSVIGFRPVGFRAPLFKFNENCWIALQENGYIYDSSVVCSPFYGKHKIFLPTKPFHIHIPEQSNGSLLEIPVSTNPFLPFPLGGTWIRIFGSRWSKIGIKMGFISQTPVVFYIHPKDVVPRKYGRKWYYYRNTGNCMKMLEEVIKYAKQNGAKFLKAIELANLEIRRKYS